MHRGARETSWAKFCARSFSVLRPLAQVAGRLSPGLPLSGFAVFVEALTEGSAAYDLGAHTALSVLRGKMAPHASWAGSVKTIGSFRGKVV